MGAIIAETRWSLRRLVLRIYITQLNLWWRIKRIPRKIMRLATWVLLLAVTRTYDAVFGYRVRRGWAVIHPKRRLWSISVIESRYGGHRR